MNATEDFILLLLHAHVVAAAGVIKSETPTLSLDELANSIITRFVCLQRNSEDECEDKVHMYAIETLSLGLIWHGYHDAVGEGAGDRI